MFFFIVEATVLMRVVAIIFIISGTLTVRIAWLRRGGVWPARSSAPVGRMDGVYLQGGERQG
eukprot:1555439-Prorocentrum_lima.AAC.1